MTKPYMMVRHAYDLTPERLIQSGIRGVILDIDNTLTAHGSQQISPEMKSWLADIKASDIKAILLSNNRRARVEPFARMLGLDYVHSGAKPLWFGFVRCLRMMGLRRSDALVVGDQLYTDILGAKIFGIRAALVLPIGPEDELFLRFKRKIERNAIKRYKKFFDIGE